VGCGCNRSRGLGTVPKSYVISTVLALLGFGLGQSCVPWPSRLRLLVHAQCHVHFSGMPGPGPLPSAGSYNHPHGARRRKYRQHGMLTWTVLARRARRGALDWGYVMSWLAGVVKHMHALSVAAADGGKDGSQRKAASSAQRLLVRRHGGACRARARRVPS